jgi:diaminohydroxyphosphoribosylaminopyrimidine deaminase/5-amino-6-(5-phosphoribosylamino)uracil reductase
MRKKPDIEYMKMALRLAAKAKGRTHPNPMVGALLVKNGKIIGKGYHRKAGKDHAEFEAIKNAAGRCSGATMFVTLEPCDHHGKTPPCTQAIIKHGIKTVKIAVKDPNPLNNGRGIGKLRKSGISVDLGLCAEEALALNKKYFKFISTNFPYVTLKLAQSVDGKIAARDGSSKWITSEISRKYARQARSDFDAIVVGVNTVFKDDPLLLGDRRRGERITRIVVDSRLRTPPGSKILKTAKRSPVLFATTELAPRSSLKKFRKIEGVEVVETKSKKAKVSLKPFLRKLAAKGITSILVEGGGELAGSFLDGNMVDEVMFFIAPKIIGGGFSSVKGKGARNINSVVDLQNIETKKIGRDILVRGVIR